MVTIRKLAYNWYFLFFTTAGKVVENQLNPKKISSPQITIYRDKKHPVNTRRWLSYIYLL